MNGDGQQLTALKRAIREPLAALTAVEVDTQARAVDLIHLLRKEIGDRPAAEIKIQGSENAGKLHDECIKAVQGWAPDSGVLFLVDTGGMEEIQAREFWVKMNGLRESWASLQCHVVFFLLPGSYLYFLRIADHLADWAPLKFHFTEPPDKTENHQVQESRNHLVFDDPSFSPKVARQLISALEPELAAALQRGDEKSLLTKRFFFPLFKAALALGDFQRAKSLRSHIKESEISPSELPEWWDLNIRLSLGRYSLKSAREYAEKLKLWAKKKKLPSSQANAYHQLGRITEEQRDFETAEIWYRKSLTIKEKQGNEHGAAMSYHQLGIIAQEQRDFETADIWYRKSLAISEKQGNEHRAAMSYHQLGIIAQEQRDFETADIWYRKSLAISEKQGNEHHAASTYHQLGTIAQEQRDFETAEIWYRKSLEISEKRGNERVAAITYHQLGMIAQEQQDLETAEIWYRKSLAIEEEQGNERGAASTYHQLGMIAQEQRDLETAEIWYRKSLAIKEKQENEYGAASTYHQLGMIAQEQRDLETAEIWYRKSLAIKEKQENEYGAASTYHQLGRIKGFENDFEEAGKWLVNSFLIFDQSNSQYEARIVSNTFIKFFNQADYDARSSMMSHWRNAGLPDLPEFQMTPPHINAFPPSRKGKTKETTP